MIKGKTESGFEFAIEKVRLENYELVELLADVDDNPILLPKLIRVFLGDEQAQKLKEHLRDDKGFISTKKLTAELMSIFSSVKELKN